MTFGEQTLQFTPGHKLVLVGGELHDTRDAPVPSPGGVAASIEFIDRSLLAPLGFRLEPIPQGYRIAVGARFAEPLTIRPTAADFDATTTLVLTLERAAEATPEMNENGEIVVSFDDASPRLDPTSRLRSNRVRSVTSNGEVLLIKTLPNVGLLGWHNLDGPPRVILELGRVFPTPTPAPATTFQSTGPSPIVIDPGHGGKDTGAVSENGLTERDLTMAVALRLAGELRARGHAVRLTREDGEGRALTDRTAIANRLEAEVFVSLHANASTFSSVRGSETYYMSLDDQASDEGISGSGGTRERGRQWRRDAFGPRSDSLGPCPGLGYSTNPPSLPPGPKPAQRPARHPRPRDQTSSLRGSHRRHHARDPGRDRIPFQPR